VQIASANSVDIIGAIFLPPTVAFAALAVAYSVERGVAGARSLSPATKRMNFYGFFLILGANYIIAVFGVLKLPDWALWSCLITWAASVLCFAWWRRQKDEGTGRNGTTASTD
jgi:hypothetical protein